MKYPTRTQPLAASAAQISAVLLVGTLVMFTTACGRISQSEARRLVERYNKVVCQAYRLGDVRLIDPVVGPNEGKKLTGLIGVRLDLGLGLDATLESLEITRVEQAPDEIRVGTRERWSYRDVRLASGQQVGEASRDAYEMRYVFKRLQGAWLVDEIQFTAPPQVGRKQTTWLASGDAHAAPAAEPSREKEQP